MIKSAGSLWNVRCGGKCCLLHIFVAMCYLLWLWWVWDFGCCCLKHRGQVLSQALSGTVGHCEHMSGTVGLSGCRAVGILDSLTLLDRTDAWFLSSLVEKWCRALSGMSSCRAVRLSGLSGSCQVPVRSCCRAVEPGLNLCIFLYIF